MRFTYFAPLVFILSIWIIIRIVLLSKNKKHEIKFNMKREIILNIFFIYIFCLVDVTLLPENIDFNGHHKIIANIVPIVETVKSAQFAVSRNTNGSNLWIKLWVRNIFGNLFLMFPLGVMLPLLWKKYSRMSKTVLFAFCLSLSIETLQLMSNFIISSNRAFDVDDIILNTLGALIGFSIYKIFSHTSQKTQESSI